MLHSLKSIEEELKRHKAYPVSVFVFRFLLLSIPFQMVLQFEPAMKPLEEIVAEHTALLLRVLGKNASASGVNVIADKVDITVIASCTGWRSIAAFLALVFAVPAVSWKKRLNSWYSVPVIYAINITRLASLAYAAEFGADAVEIMHGFLWKEGLVAVVLLAWFIWLKSDGR